MSKNSEVEYFSFWQEVVLDLIPLLKWPILLFTLWLTIPSNFSFSDFLQENQVQKVAIGDAMLERSVGEKVKVMKAVNDLSNDIKQVTDELSQLSSGYQEKEEEELNKIKQKLNNINEQSQGLMQSKFNTFVPNTSILKLNKFKPSFNYEVVKDNKKVVDIEIGIDQFPFSAEFDLCKESGQYKFLKSIKYDKNKKPNDLAYEDKKVDCMSFVKVERFGNNSYRYEFDLKILDGFKIVKTDGFDVFLPVRSFNAVSSIYSRDGKKLINESFKNNKVNKQTFVYIE